MTLQESICYYRSHLTGLSKPVYDSLYREMQKDMTALSYEFTVPSKCSMDDCSDAYGALAMDHPELYPLQYGVSIRVIGDLVSFKTNKSFSKNTAAHIEKELQNCVSEVTRGLRGRSGFEKEFIVYSRLTKMLAYSCKEKASHSILAPVLMHKGSCDGRSQLLTLCLRAVGIPCIVVRNDNHMWNMASIDGHNVWLDCTYEAIRNDRLAYFYFNLDDRQLQIDHVIDRHLPKCNDEGYDFFNRFGLAFKTRQEVIDYIRAEYREGSDTISFKLNDADEQTLVAAMLEGLPEGSGSCSYIVNQSKNAVIMTFGDRKKAST